MNSQKFSVEDVIRIFIQYRGSRQGLFCDYGRVFDDYLDDYKEELKHCSLFEYHEREHTLAIRFENKQFKIYYCDERASIWGNVYTYDSEEEAFHKYMELYRLGVHTR